MQKPVTRKVTITTESAWRKAGCMSAAGSMLPPDNAWAYLPDGRGNSYYANLTTGETSWERPGVARPPCDGLGGACVATALFGQEGWRSGRGRRHLA